MAVVALCGCATTTIYHTNHRLIAPARLNRTINIALSWPAPVHVDALAGAVPIRDGPPVVQAELAIARAILRTNPRLAQTSALLFAVTTARAARAALLPPEFFGATLLQESAYDPAAFSLAGAVGIAQFMPDTAAGLGVNPYDPFDAIDGAAALLGSYVAAYRGRYADPYAAALAAYNAGPLAVAHYHGVPPYPETREYVALIYDRWARIVSYERIGGLSGHAWKRSGR